MTAPGGDTPVITPAKPNAAPTKPRALNAGCSIAHEIAIVLDPEIKAGVISRVCLTALAHATVAVSMGVEAG
jgi:hypothetical protein